MLLAMTKQRVNDDVHAFSQIDSKLVIPLQSTDQREYFLLDIGRGRINLLKGTYQTRARQIVILARIDFGGSPHRNPDGTDVACPHLHLYREGFGDKWAEPVPVATFESSDDRWQLFQDFLKFCNVILPPIMQRGLII